LTFICPGSQDVGQLGWRVSLVSAMESQALGLTGSGVMQVGCRELCSRGAALGLQGILFAAGVQAAEK